MNIPCPIGSSKVILYFHANAEDVVLAHELLDYVKSLLRVHIIAVEYPGYGLYTEEAQKRRNYFNNPSFIPQRGTVVSATPSKKKTKREVEWIADPTENISIDDHAASDAKHLDASLMERDNPLGAPAFSEDGSASAVVNNKFENLRDSVEQIKEKSKYPSKTPRFGTNKTRQSKVSSQQNENNFSGPVINQVASKPEQEYVSEVNETESPKTRKTVEESTVKKEGQQPVLEAGSRIKLQESLASGKGRNLNDLGSEAGRSYNVSISSEEDTERLADAVKGLG